MRKVLYILLTVLAGLLVSATTVYAVGPTSSVPPEAFIKVGGVRVQHMNIHEFTWYYPYIDGGYSWTADRMPGDPKPAYVWPKVKQTDVKIDFVIRYADRPEKLYVRTKDGDFLGRALYPIKRNGKTVAWGGYFYRTGHHRYVFFAKWAKGTEGHSYGTVTYLANLKQV